MPHTAKGPKLFSMAFFLALVACGVPVALAVLLPVPPVVSSENGMLDIVLTLDRATVTTSSGRDECQAHTLPSFTTQEKL